MKSSKPTGYSLIELLVAASLMSAIVFSGYSLVNLLFRRNAKASQEVSLGALSDRVLGNVLRTVGNAIVLTPPEGIATTTDGLYPGFSAIPSNVTVPGCDYQADSATRDKYAILRVSSFENRMQPELLVRGWSDSTIDTVPIRISYHAPTEPPPHHAFQIAAAPPTEIYLIDANLVAMRRFMVGTQTEVLNTHLDPADDVDRTPNVYNYRTVQLIKSKTATSLPHAATGSFFTTGSFVYSARTRLYCRSPDGKFIAKDELSGNIQVLLDPEPFGKLLSRLEFRFYGTKPTERTEMSLFTLFPFADFNARICANSVLLSMEYTSAAGNEAPYIVNRVITLSAFNARRPAQCL